MRVVRGRAADREGDRAVTRSLFGDAADGEPVVRVWSPHRQLAFGRRDRREPGYDRAVVAAERRGYPAVERDVGGRAVAYTGETLAFVRVESVDDARAGTGDRYDRALGAVRGALADLGVEATEGEPPAAFCPGAHSLSVAGIGKLAGLAQRVTADAASVAGVLLVRGGVADVLEAVYDALGVPFDPTTVGSVAAAGGPDDPERVARAVESALVGERAASVERLA
jgi:lipoate-protein ligase A